MIRASKFFTLDTTDYRVLADRGYQVDAELVPLPVERKQGALRSFACRRELPSDHQLKLRSQRQLFPPELRILQIILR